MAAGTMTASDVLRNLYRSGYTVRVDQGRIVVDWGKPFKDPVKAVALIKEHEAEMVEILTGEVPSWVESVFPGARRVG